MLFFFIRLMDTCRSKCIPPHYHEPDLNKGEMTCIDRCVFKYGAVQKYLGKKMDAYKEAGASESPSTL